MKLNIAFIGMTHLGIISSIACASKKINTISYDEDHNLIKLLRKKKFSN